MKLDARLTLFITLVMVFITCLITGDLIGGKLTSVHLFGEEWVFSVGQLAFPVTFILTDILNEFYGRQVVRRVTVIAFVMVGVSFGFIYWAAAMPWASFTQATNWTGVGTREFGIIFTQATEIQIGSMFAFLVANLVDVSVFWFFKRLTGNRMLWLRATGSTAVSQLIDTIVISAVIWQDKVTFGQFSKIVIASYVLKLTVAIVVTPIIYGLHEVIEKRFGLVPVPLETKPDPSAQSGSK